MQLIPMQLNPHGNVCSRSLVWLGLWGLISPHDRALERAGILRMDSLYGLPYGSLLLVGEGYESLKKGFRGCWIHRDWYGQSPGSWGIHGHSLLPTV